jgi:integrase
MARIVKDTSLDSRTARSRLKPRGKPYWRSLEPKLHLGFRKPRGRKGKPAGGGAWVARYYVGKQCYVTETIGTADDLSDADGVTILSFAQAQAVARKRMSERGHSEAGIAAGPLTVREAVEQYLGWLESKRKSAYHSRRTAEALIYPKLGDVECASLTTDKLEGWLHKIAREPLRSRTGKGKPQKYRAFDSGDPEAVRRRQASTNRIFTVLKAALNRAWRNGKIASDTAWRRVENFENVDAARIRYLNLAECKRLVNATDPEFRPMVLAALQTGARYGELCRLEVGDFNPDAGTIAIRQSKSGKARHVVLTEEGSKLFEQLAAGKTSHRLLLTHASGKPFDKSNQQKPMIGASTRAKIKPRVNFHALRHTWASLAVMGGVPLMVVAKNLGHVDTRMVEKHYGHLSPNYVAEAVRKSAPRFGIALGNVVALR